MMRGKRTARAPDRSGKSRRAPRAPRARPQQRLATRLRRATATHEASLLANGLLARATDDMAGQYVPDQTEARINAMRGTGAPLPRDVSTRLGRALDDRFDDVRTHTDSAADTLSRQLNAEAFTVGRDVFFRSGVFAPGTDAGERLLGHELTHVKQQRGMNTSGALRVSDPSEPAERHARSVGEAVAASRPARPQDAEVEGVQTAPTHPNAILLTPNTGDSGRTGASGALFKSRARTEAALIARKASPAAYSTGEVDSSRASEGSVNFSPGRVEFIDFSPGDSKPKPVHEKYLRKLVLENQLASQSRGVELSIIGYTDAVGGRDRNADLRAQRAGSVAQLLVQDLQVAPELINSVRSGPSNEYLTGNDTPEARSHNRAVLVEIKSSGTQKLEAERKPREIRRITSIRYNHVEEYSVSGPVDRRELGVDAFWRLGTGLYAMLKEKDFEPPGFEVRSSRTYDTIRSDYQVNIVQLQVHKERVAYFGGWTIWTRTRVGYVWGPPNPKITVTTTWTPKKGEKKAFMLMIPSQNPQTVFVPRKSASDFIIGTD